MITDSEICHNLEVSVSHKKNLSYFPLDSFSTFAVIGTKVKEREEGTIICIPKCCLLSTLVLSSLNDLFNKYHQSSNFYIFFPGVLSGNTNTHTHTHTTITQIVQMLRTHTHTTPSHCTSFTVTVHHTGLYPHTHAARLHRAT